MQNRDFNSMQEQAINRAREMHRKATPPQNSEPQQRTDSGNPYPPPNDVFSHRNPWTQTQQTPFCKNACPIKNMMGMNGKGDDDMILLMSIMLLLSADGADRMLMLALLYIMT